MDGYKRKIRPIRASIFQLKNSCHHITQVFIHFSDIIGHSVRHVLNSSQFGGCVPYTSKLIDTSYSGQFNYCGRLSGLLTAMMDAVARLTGVTVTSGLVRWTCTMQWSVCCAYSIQWSV